MRLQQMNQDRSPSRCETVISLACKLGMVVFVIMTQLPCPVPIYSVMEQPVMQDIVIVNGLLNLKLNCVQTLYTVQFQFPFTKSLTMSCMTGCFHITAHILCTQFSFKFHLLNLLTMSCMTGCFHTTAALPIHSVHTTQFSFKINRPFTKSSNNVLHDWLFPHHCPYTLYTVQFQIPFTKSSNNVLHDGLFPHHCGTAHTLCTHYTVQFQN